MKSKIPPVIEVLKAKTMFMQDNAFCKANCNQEEISLPFCLPAEEVEFQRVTYNKKSFDYYKSIIKASDDRIKPQCKHFTVCGGCVLQHANDRFYKEFKQSLIINAFLKHKIIMDENILKPLLVMPKSQRRRANLEAVKKNGQLTMGFHKLKSYQINDMHECPSLTKNLEKTLIFIRQMCEAILKDFQKIKIFLLETDNICENNIDVGIEIQGISELDQEQINSIKTIALNSNWQRFQFKYRKKINTIYQKSAVKLRFKDLEVDVSPWDFAQASVLAQNAMQEILNQTLNQSGLKKESKALDLFCGRGTFASVLLSHFSHIEAYEGDKSAILDLSNALNNVGVKNLNCYVRDLFLNPLNTDELNKFNFLVIDPPRAGAQEQIKQIAHSNVKNVFYISCNPDTFAKDAKMLIDNNYSLNFCQGIDQFLWSNHLEVIGFFQKI